MAICVLNHEQYNQWKQTGERPGCRYHRHVSYKEALKKIENDEAWVINELRAIVVYTCIDRYVWQGRRSAGFSAMQLCAIHGRKSPLPLCEEARRG